MKHIFFDLDHTLWDFETNSKIAIEKLFFDFEMNTLVKSFEKFHSTYKTYNSKLWRQYGQGKITKDILRTKRFRDTLANFNIHNEEIAIAMGEQYVKTAPFQTQLFPNTIKTLDQLKKEGFEMHIITNGFKEVQFIKLEKSGILDFFDIVVCSEDVGMNKPAPQVFHYALEKANAKPQDSFMIGDDHRVDVMGSESVGMAGILFDPHKSYRAGIHEWHIHQLDEIPALLPWIASKRKQI